MKYTNKDHTFAICAYGESKYLEECIKSVKAQTIKTNIIMATSTPNDYIKGLADKYEIKLFINTAKSNIASDWNFAYKNAGTDLVTITHQDDIYKERYAESVINNFNKAAKPLIAFTDYSELREGGVEVSDNKLLNIKRVMLSPLKIRGFWKSKFVRRRILSFGSPICCPSVTFVKSNLPDEVFKVRFRGGVDWEAWEMISRLKGSFVYCPEILMSHRIHEESATTTIIADNDRTKEDFEMFCRFWPKWIAKIIEHFYSDSEKQNELD
ncbi:MAG: glycosyltransferase family 2 protein [Butyrivibrio sp.]|nr:glycosyltransferase family 2 protein [Butyrivibrio sp.]